MSDLSCMAYLFEGTNSSDDMYCMYNRLIADEAKMAKDGMMQSTNRACMGWACRQWDAEVIRTLYELGWGGN